jgi:hypothetical protein
MGDESDEEIAFAWIDERKNYEDRKRTNSLWALASLDSICAKDPARGLRIIEGICSKDCSAPVIEVLAAGPMEELLVKHGPKIIEQVEEVAGRNPRFKELLGGVWQRETESGVWERVVAARSRAW